MWVLLLLRTVLLVTRLTPVTDVVTDTGGNTDKRC